jgi:hypothetical protein
MTSPRGYVDVDRLQAETTLEEATAKWGAQLDIKGFGPEVRIDCVFGCPGDHVGRKEIAVNVQNDQKIFQCHAYLCEKFQGNLLVLMHGLLTGSKPTGGRLKGAEFQRVKQILASTGLAIDKVLSSVSPKPSPSVATPPAMTNTPLIDSADERIRELHNVDEKLILDVAKMNPAAASYVRRHSCLTPESMTKWRCGYLPNDGGGDKRGWSLRRHFIYPLLSEQGKVLAWIGRDVNYEQKELAFRRLSSAERAAQEPPAKHRLPKGLARGVELFGQQASRLQEPGYREFISKYGFVICEGFNDVIGLDNLGIPALGIMSNRMTDAQGEKVVRFAKMLGVNRVNLMFDCEESGSIGAKEALWFFAEHQIDVRLLWSPSMHEGALQGKQPESLSHSEIQSLLSSLPTIAS